MMRLNNIRNSENVETLREREREQYLREKKKQVKIKAPLLSIFKMQTIVRSSLCFLCTFKFM